MVIFAHPDDAEGNCGGTVAKWATEGKLIFYLCLTNGNKGSNDLLMTMEKLAVIREQEQREAAKKLGVSEVIFFGANDGELEYSLENRKKITRIIRKYQPDIVVTHDPWKHYQLHPDHRIAGFIALDSVVAARDHLFFPEQIKEGLNLCRVKEVYLFGSETPDTCIDITSTIELKIDSIKCHKSQISQHPEIEMRVRNWAKKQGETGGMDYAEAFKRIVP